MQLYSSSFLHFLASVSRPYDGKARFKAEGRRGYSRQEKGRRQTAQLGGSGEWVLVMGGTWESRLFACRRVRNRNLLLWHVTLT